MKCNTNRTNRLAFDVVAELYNRIRALYPEKLYKDIFEYSQLQPDARLLEIGCGTAQATLTLAKNGNPIVAIEPGRNLSKIAATNVEEY